jgi:hypothetical protein
VPWDWRIPLQIEHAVGPLKRIFVAVLTLAVSGGISLVATTSAVACPTTHCYGAAFGSTSSFDGVSEVVTPLCLTTSTGNFVTDEAWLASSDSTYWVEAGYIVLGSGVNMNGIPSPGRYLFWGDKRPVDNTFIGHVMETSPSLTGRTVAIWKVSPGIFTAQVGSYTQNSTNNSMVPGQAIYGSETPAAGSHSHGHSATCNTATRLGGSRAFPAACRPGSTHQRRSLGDHLVTYHLTRGCCADAKDFSNEFALSDGRYSSRRGGARSHCC